MDAAGPMKPAKRKRDEGAKEPSGQRKRNKVNAEKIKDAVPLRERLKKALGHTISGVVWGVEGAADLDDPKEGKEYVDDLLRRFQAEYQTELELLAFVGLCGHLRVLLRWGYTISPGRFDDFIMVYPQYEEILASTKQMIIATGDHKTKLPSYHHWFAQERMSSPAEGGLLTPEALVEVCCAYPWTAMCAEGAMEYIAEMQYREVNQIGGQGRQ